VNLLLLKFPNGATYFRTRVVAYFRGVSVKDESAILNVSLLFTVMPQVKGYYPTYVPLYVKGMGEGVRMRDEGHMTTEMLLMARFAHCRRHSRT
jgi:hypothetical protein